LTIAVAAQVQRYYADLAPGISVVTLAELAARPHLTADPHARAGELSPFNTLACVNDRELGALRPGSSRTAAPYYAHDVSSSAAPNGEDFEVVVDTDGALRVPAEELARHGVRPGAHLRLIPQLPPRTQRRRAHGALAGVVDAAALDALEAALGEAKAQRIAAIERRWA